MESMTGYAFVEKSTKQFSFSVEIKSLNSKYLETYVTLPKILKNEENDLHNLLKSFFSRGKIECNIDIFDWNETRPISLNDELIKKYYRELKKIHKELGIKEPIRFESVLSLEGISQRERTVLTREAHKAIYDTIAAVAKKAIDMRKKEGASVKKDLVKSLGEIVNNINLVKKMAKDIPAEKKEQLRTRIEALAGAKVDDMRIYTEISILADKLDINEEIVRLDDHIAKFRTIMAETDQVGRKLDFLAQEMFREINTIGSKSNSSTIAHIVVDLKNYIDKIREQCRNIV